MLITQDIFTAKFFSDKETADRAVSLLESETHRHYFSIVKYNIGDKTTDFLIEVFSGDGYNFEGYVKAS